MTFKQKTLQGDNVIVSKQSKSKKNLDSEFQSYTYIKNELRDLGWNIKNPNREPQGHLYTQHESLRNPEIKSMLEKQVPEYIVKLREDAFWVIEAKPTPDEVEAAYREAMDYGKVINKHTFIRAKIVSGVGGNDIDRYLVKTGFWDESVKSYVPIVYDNKAITSLLTPDMATTILDLNSPILKKYEIDEERFVRTSETINEILHAASIRKDKRATVVATILLSLLADTEPNYNDNPEVFVSDINNRAEDILKHHKKANFFKYIRIELPEKRDAQLKFKDALVSTVFQLKKVDIKAAMRAGSDILGKFYETFLKYGNGAKDLGILLTPRHVTQLAAEVLEINHSDILYDPTCGTGGFLVSAFYHVKEKASKEQLDIFKQYGIFGIDQQSSVAALAIVNMIFRGDGKNNIVNDNCLSAALIPDTVNGYKSAKFASKNSVRTNGSKAATKVLMNPPFALDEEDEKEYRFVDHALEQMEDGGLLFSIFPLAGLVKGGIYLSWRRKLLENHTLLSVISLPRDTFYPSTTQPTIAFIVRKGVPHPRNQNVLWLRVTRDGFVKTKGRRLPSDKESNELEKIKDTVRAFIHSPNMKVERIPKFQKASPIDFTDSFLELVPEAYLESEKPTIQDIEHKIDSIIRETIGFLIKQHFEQKLPQLKDKPYVKKQELASKKFSLIPVIDIFTIESGDFHSTENELSSGIVPLISCGDLENGLVGFFATPDVELLHKNAFTVAYNGQPLTTKFHTYSFLAKDDVAVCYPKSGIMLETAIFTAAVLNLETWRYSYGRKCFKQKLNRMLIPLPVNDKEQPDQTWISDIVQSNPYWDFLASHMK